MPIEVVRLGQNIDFIEFTCGSCLSALRCTEHDLHYGAISGHTMGWAVICPVCSGRVVVREEST